MTEQLNNGQHSQTSVLEFTELTLLEFFGGQLRVEFGEEESTPVVDGSNQEDHLGPSQSRDSLDGGDTVGDGVGVEFTGDKVVVGTGEFGEDVSEDGKLGDTSVLEFGSTVLVEFFLADSVRESEGVCWWLWK